MKDKILYTVLMLIITFGAAQASDKVHVSALESFSTVSPSESIDVKVISPSNLGIHLLYAGDVIHCDVVKISNPKRGKRSASFAVNPVYYITQDKKVNITENMYGKYAEKVLSAEEIKNIDAMKVGKKAAITVGNHFVKGVAPVASLAEGIVKNEEGNRLESGVKQVYKDSVFSYVEKGQHLDIKQGDEFYLVFKQAKSKSANDISEEADENENNEE